MSDLPLSRVVNLVALGGAGTMASEIITREKARGFIVLHPGEVIWFPLHRWNSDSVIALDGMRARLVLLNARRRSVGYFRKLIADIEQASLIPVVVEPHPRLERTLKGWGWKHRRTGRGIETENIWYPKGAP